MPLTLLMTGVLIVSFMLMFALVQFSDIIITREKTVEPAARDGEASRNG
jgi:hypothetical protein